MKKLRIFVDFAIPPDAMEILKHGTSDHTLLLPSKPAASVLSKAERDPQFITADVAFGQPEVDAIAEARDLKWVHVSSSGYTRYDSESFRRLVSDRKLAVSNSALVYDEACAVHVLGFMLAQARILPEALATRTANGTAQWHSLRAACGTLRGETVLILGFGAIGKRLVELLQPFHVNVIAWRRRARGNEGVPLVSSQNLADAMARADHVVNILPDSAETRGFFSREMISKLKDGAVFYNIGRGATVDQKALQEALVGGRLRAAWLDVTDPEPLPDEHPLWKVPNCHITPHIAGGFKGEAKRLVSHFIENLRRFERGESLLDRIM